MPFSSRMMLRITLIARMRLAGIKDLAIAKAQRLSNSGLQRILRTSDYIEYEEALLHGQLSKMDEALAENVDVLKAQHRVMRTMAERTVMEIAMKRRDLRSALGAAKEILDRDPDRLFVKDSIVAPGPASSAGLPASLFQAIARDADGVATSVNLRLRTLEKQEIADA